MQIFIRGPTEEMLTLEVDGSDTARSIKSRIQDSGREESDIRLFRSQLELQWRVAHDSSSQFLNVAISVKHHGPVEGIQMESVRLHDIRRDALSFSALANTLVERGAS